MWKQWSNRPTRPRVAVRTRWQPIIPSIRRPTHSSPSFLSAKAPSPPPPPSAPFEVLQTVEDVRRWRMEKLLRAESVGFVPTMGSLHEGHLNLARHSLSQCDHTVVSIFVNPAQFAPHEDLATYPRTVADDIAKLGSLDVARGSLQIPKHFDSLKPSSAAPSRTSEETGNRLSALFLPSVDTLYPSGIEQDVSKQIGTFVEVKGFSHQMEGRTRPTFFRGVATVVLKLFNIVQPDKAFFGQKDIQQCIVLRQMLRDLHLPHPSSPTNLVVIPTERDPASGLALSSRNAYLSPAERDAATTLSKALFAGKKVFEEKSANGPVDARTIREAAESFVLRRSEEVKAEGQVELKLDYIAVNDPVRLQDLDVVEPGRGAILSGAMYCGKTRLIDNIVIDFDLNA